MSGLVGYDSSDEDKDIRDVSVGDLKVSPSHALPKVGALLIDQALDYDPASTWFIPFKRSSKYAYIPSRKSTSLIINRSTHEWAC